MASLGDLVVNLRANTAQFTRSMRSAETRISSFARKSFRALTDLRTLIAGAAVTSVTGAMIRLAAQAETLSVQFKVLTGSATTAKRVMADVAAFAAETPFQKLEIAESARSLLAFGSSAHEVVAELRMLGDIAAATGTPLGDLSQIFGKARVQGRLFAEDINQLTGRGIPIIGAIADQFGVAESEVKKLVEAGQVGFPQLLKALQSMTEAGGKFAGMMSEMSETTTGKWSTLKDNVSELAAAMGEELLPVLNEVLDKLTELAKENNTKGKGLQGFYQNLNIGFLEVQRRVLKLKADFDDLIDTTDWASNLRRVKGQTNDVQRQLYKDAVDRATDLKIMEVLGLDPNSGKALPGAGSVIEDPVGPQMPQRVADIRAGAMEVVSDYLTQTALPMLLKGAGTGSTTKTDMWDTFAVAAQGRKLMPGFTGWDMPPGAGIPGLSGLAGVGLGFGVAAQQAAMGASGQAPLQFAGAAERGSVESLDTLMRAMNQGSGSPQKQANKLLADMNKKLDNGIAVKPIGEKEFAIVEEI